MNGKKCMKKKLAALIVMGSMVLGTGGMPILAEEPAEEITESSQAEHADFSFADLKNYQFAFASGVGAWGTSLNIRADGSFSGEFTDSDMGDTGEGYPNGSRYVSRYYGQFEKPSKINEHVYSTRISELHYEDEVGTEEIEDGVRLIYTTVHGLAGAEEIRIYMPGITFAEVSERVRSNFGYQERSGAETDTVSDYILCNETEGCVFRGYNVAETLRNMAASLEEETAALEASMQNDSLSQTELEEKTKEFYDRWDYFLNHIWRALKESREKEVMSALTEEELVWIEEKEAAAEEAGAQYEEGSMRSAAMYRKAAELTKERVYELLELFEQD